MGEPSLKANEHRIYGLFLAVALLPAAADAVQAIRNKERVVSEIYVKTCNLILLCAGLYQLAQRVCKLNALSFFFIKFNF